MYPRKTRVRIIQNPSPLAQASKVYQPGAEGIVIDDFCGAKDLYGKIILVHFDTGNYSKEDNASHVVMVRDVEEVPE